MEPGRLDRDIYFMTIALVVSLRSTCRRAQVGAILVRDRRILATGYNGAPRGFPHCTRQTCSPLGPQCRATVHAELNAILSAAYHGISTSGSTLYTTLEPCDDCCFAIINAGIERVFYWKPYSDEAFLTLESAGIELIGLSPANIFDESFGAGWVYWRGRDEQQPQ